MVGKGRREARVPEDDTGRNTVTEEAGAGAGVFFA